MSRSGRIALVVAAAAVALVAFLIARPGDDESERSAATPAQTDTKSDAGNGAAEPSSPAARKASRIAIQGGSVVGAPKTIDVTKGETVRIVVTADAPDDIHLHGYDIERKVAPGQPARFRFEANAEGEFEIESHVAEDAGRDPLVARLVVAPS